MPMMKLEKYGPLAARASLALIFLLSGFGKLAALGSTAGYIASKGLPAPALLAMTAALVELVGGASVLLGWKARWGALALIAYLVPVTLLFHNPAGLEGMAAQMEVIQFLKNLAIAGGLLAVASFGPGQLALEGRRARGAVGAR
jgi:putative oxidoreductase